MTQYEQLCDLAYNQSIAVLINSLPERLRGLYYEYADLKVITLNSLIETGNERLCVLAEEIGHSIIGGGDLLFGNIPELLKRKYELKARSWAYNHLLPAKKLIAQLKQQMSVYEIAEDNDVTEDFVYEAIEHYKRKSLIPYYNDYNENDFSE